MDRTTAKALRTKLNAIFEEHGIEGYHLELGNATYNSTEVTFKLLVREQGAKSREQRDLESMARIAELDVNKIGDGVYTLMGYRSRARKNPWIIQNKYSGKEYVIDNATATRWFGKDAV